MRRTYPNNNESGLSRSLDSIQFGKPTRVMTTAQLHFQLPQGCTSRALNMELQDNPIP